ncbi:MAG TPA: AgmX/PglI C-terminal domain-containing protein [Polyangiaceae bacterium]|nr:AgmX/PglI C-terminal domain-containing protein [Polyangiaceae bacterium]
MKACSLVGPLGAALLLLLPVTTGCGGGRADAKPAESPSSEAAPAAPPADEAKGSETAPPESAPGGEAATPSSGDTRTLESIQALVKEHRKEARDCYEKALKEIPGLKGDVVIEFIVNPSGKVKHAELNEARSTIREASLSACVVDVITKIQFPRSSKGKQSRVNYPFNFNP